MKFICGCDSEDPHVKNYHPHLVAGKFTTKHHDKDGNEVCPIHSVPLVGFASPVKQGPQGNMVPDHRADFLRRYGRTPKNFTPGTGIEDRRDNHDPTEIGYEILAGSNGQPEAA